jgi:hypothetical protein
MCHALRGAGAFVYPPPHSRKKGLEGMVEQPERYCRNCGHELKPENQFCTNCGMPVHRAARVPTPEADRPVPPLPPPTQEVGRRRSLPDSDALRGRGIKLAVLLVLGVLVLYLVLPLVMESLIEWKLQTEWDTSTQVDVDSIFPPMMLLGSIDEVHVSSKQITLPDRDVTYYDAKVDMRGLSVSVPSLIVGKPVYETEHCFVRYVQAQIPYEHECPPELSGSSSP